MAMTQVRFVAVLLEFDECLKALKTVRASVADAIAHGTDLDTLKAHLGGVLSLTPIPDHTSFIEERAYFRKYAKRNEAARARMRRLRERKEPTVQQDQVAQAFSLDELGAGALEPPLHVDGPLAVPEIVAPVARFRDWRTVRFTRKELDCLPLMQQKVQDGPVAQADFLSWLFAKIESVDRLDELIARAIAEGLIARDAQERYVASG